MISVLRNVSTNIAILDGLAILTAAYIFLSGKMLEIVAVDDFFIARILFAILTIGIMIANYSVLSKRDIDERREVLDVVWFLSPLCMNIGLAGTVVGFIAMIKAAFADGPLNASNIEAVMGLVGQHWSSALYSTAIGVIAAIVLQFYGFVASRNDKNESAEQLNKMLTELNNEG